MQLKGYFRLGGRQSLGCKIQASDLASFVDVIGVHTFFGANLLFLGQIATSDLIRKLLVIQSNSGSWVHSGALPN